MDMNKCTSLTGRLNELKVGQSDRMYVLLLLGRVELLALQ